MAKKPKLSDDLDIDELSADLPENADDDDETIPADRAEPSEQKPVADGPSSLEEIQEALTALSEDYWARYRASLDEKLVADNQAFDFGDDGYKGAFVVLEGVDFSRQAKLENRPCVFHENAGEQMWGIACNKRYNQILHVMREVQIDFGWPETQIHDVAGSIDGLGVLIFWDWDIATQSAPILRLQAVRIPDQFAVFYHPEQGPRVPGLHQARAQLEAFREAQEATVPSEIKEPRDLIEPLLKSLELSDFELFVSLLVSSGRAMAERRFLQFRKSWDACAGNVTFDRYDARFNLDNYEKLGSVKVFVERSNTDGTTKNSPLVVVKEDDKWRIKSGMI